MTGFVPDLVKAGFVLATGAIPASLIAVSSIPDVEKYGIVGGCVIIMGVSFKMWQNSSKEVTRLHGEIVTRLEDELRRERERERKK